MSKSNSAPKPNVIELPAQAAPAAAPVPPISAPAASPTALMADIDELGVVKAEMAALAEREEALKAKIARDGGLGGHDGELFHVNVFESERTSTDDAFKAKVKELINKHTSAQWRAAHTSKSVSVTVKVSARSAALVAAGKVKKGEG